MRIISFTKPYLSKHRIKVLAYITVSLGLWSLSMMTPYSVGSYIDKLVGCKDASVIWNTVSKLGVLWTLQIILSYVKNLVLSSLHSKVCFEITESVLRHISGLPISFFITTDHASMNQRISADSRVITGYVLGDIENLALSILTVGCTTCIIFGLNKGILVILALLLPIYAFIYCYFKKPLYQLKYRVSEEYSKFYSLSNQFLAHIKLIKLQEWNTRFLDKLSESHLAVHKITMQNARIGFILANIDMLIRYVANISIFIYCGYRVVRQNMSIGEFTMINTYSTMVISCVGSILQFGKSYQQTSVSFDRINTLCQREQDGCGTIQLEEISEISVSNLSFGYGDKEVFSGLNLHFEKGKIYSIVGENGAGKTTLISILAGIEQNYNGVVTYNEINMRLLDHHHLREQLLSIVEQEPDLIFPTLRENISQSVTINQRILEWISLLKLSDFMASVGNNLDYSISDQAANISGGEKQKLAIIRCLLKNSEVMILDEPNSAFDEESTSALCEILKQIKHNKIIIVITHRTEIQRISDETISLDIEGISEQRKKNQIVLPVLQVKQ